MSTTKATQDNKQDNPVRWYQVPVLWLCIAIFLLTLAACAHLIMLSLEANKNHSASVNTNPENLQIAQQGTSSNHAYHQYAKVKHNEALR